MTLFTPQQQSVRITAFYAISLREFSMAPHHHEACEIMLVTKGHCQVLVGETEVELHPNEFVFLDQNIRHQLTIKETEPCNLLNLEFLPTPNLASDSLSIRRATEVSASFQQLCRHPEKYPLVVKDSRSLSSSLKALIHLLTTYPPQAGWDEETAYTGELLFNRMLLELCHCLNSDEKPQGSQHLNAALKYIREHLTENLRVQQIAEAIGINKSYLHLLFSKQLNITVNDYINRERIKLSCYLLTTSDLPLVEIALQCGFNSRQHFAGTFRKFFDMTPRDYRKLHQGDKTMANSGGQYRLEQDWHWIRMGAGE